MPKNVGFLLFYHIFTSKNKNRQNRTDIGLRKPKSVWTYRNRYDLYRYRYSPRNWNFLNGRISTCWACFFRIITSGFNALLQTWEPKSCSPSLLLQHLPPHSPKHSTLSPFFNLQTPPSTIVAQKKKLRFLHQKLGFRTRFFREKGRARLSSSPYTFCFQKWALS